MKVDTASHPSLLGGSSFQRRSNLSQKSGALVDAASARAASSMAALSVFAVEPLERCNCTTAAAGPAWADHFRRWGRLFTRAGAVARFRRLGHFEMILLLFDGPNLAAGIERGEIVWKDVVDIQLRIALSQL